MLLDHPANRVAVFGRSGSGKTTLAAKYVANIRARVRFLYDPEGEWSLRFRLRPARTAAELGAAVATGWVAFDPSTMFGSDDERGAQFFATWAFRVSDAVGGRKLFVLDEFQDHVRAGWIPDALRDVIRRGRRRGLDLLAVGQEPSSCGAVLRRQLTTVFAFQTSDPSDLDWLSRYGFDPDEVQALGRYRWICRTVQGQQTSG